MCLITDQKRAFIAEKDITVYKLLEGNMLSPYTNFTYEVGKLYKTTIKRELEEDRCCFDRRDHYDISKKWPNWPNDSSLKAFGRGFHAALKKERLMSNDVDTYYGDIYKCIIPKGSKYYVNISGLVVSNQIIVTNKKVKQ